jgi:hypothetical protein
LKARRSRDYFVLSDRRFPRLQFRATLLLKCMALSSGGIVGFQGGAKPAASRMPRAGAAFEILTHHRSSTIPLRLRIASQGRDGKLIQRDGLTASLMRVRVCRRFRNWEQPFSAECRRRGPIPC